MSLVTDYDHFKTLGFWRGLPAFPRGTGSKDYGEVVGTYVLCCTCKSYHVSPRISKHAALKNWVWPGDEAS